MSEIMSPFSILSAVNRLLPELPDLLGAEVWSLEGPLITVTLQQLLASNDEREQSKLASRLQSVLAKYPHSRMRLNAELYIQATVCDTLYESIMQIKTELGLNTRQVAGSVATAAYAFEWTINAEDIPAMEDIKTRGIKIKEGGLGGAKTIKFRNLDLDFDAASEAAAGVLLEGFAILEKPHPFVIAAGMLILILTLRKIMTVQISERDASVFWGFIQVRNQDSVALESTIFDRTNKERHRYGLKPLDEDDFRSALVTLQSLHSIERIPGRHNPWRIVEKYQIK